MSSFYFDRVDDDSFDICDEMERIGSVTRLGDDEWRIDVPLAGLGCIDFLSYDSYVTEFVTEWLNDVTL